jgi:hypothetical protein
MTPVEQVRSLLGPCVLVKILRGKKAPCTRDWQRLSQADMTSAYLASLNHDGNIGVLLGKT